MRGSLARGALSTLVGNELASCANIFARINPSRQAAPPFLSYLPPHDTHSTSSQACTRLSDLAWSTIETARASDCAISFGLVRLAILTNICVSGASIWSASVYRSSSRCVNTLLVPQAFRPLSPTWSPAGAAADPTKPNPRCHPNRWTTRLGGHLLISYTRT